MKFTEAVRSSLIDNYAQFNGRASRSEFWWFQLFNAVVWAVFYLVFEYILKTNVATFIFADNPMEVISIFYETTGSKIAFSLAAIYYIVMILPLMAVSVRRMHDVNLSGWWYFGLCIAAIALSYVNYWLPYVPILVLLCILVISGSSGDNQYGPNPLLAEGNQSVPPLETVESIEAAEQAKRNADNLT